MSHAPNSLSTYTDIPPRVSAPPLLLRRPCKAVAKHTAKIESTTLAAVGLLHIFAAAEAATEAAAEAAAEVWQLELAIPAPVSVTKETVVIVIVIDIGHGGALFAGCVLTVAARAVALVLVAGTPLLEGEGRAVSLVQRLLVRVVGARGIEGCAFGHRGHRPVAPDSVRG